MSRRNRRKKRKMIVAMVLVLLLAMIMAAFVLLFYLQKIEIEGNDYTDDSVIVSVIKEDKLSFNSVYDLLKFKFGKPELPKSLNSIHVKMKNPWTLHVSVKEKEIVGYFADGEENICFDREGIVVFRGKTLPKQVPCVEGVSLKSAKLYEKVEADNKKTVRAVLSTLEQIRNYELSPDRILSADTGIELYFGEVCVMLGTDVTAEKIAQISPILDKLDGQAGTLHLEHYESGSVITFKKDVPEEEDSSDDDAEALEDTYGEDGNGAGGDVENLYEEE